MLYIKIKLYISKVKQLKKHKMESKILKSNSRLDNSKGFLITKKEYLCNVVKPLKYGFCLIKIGNKIFKTDYKNFK